MSTVIKGHAQAQEIIANQAAQGKALDGEAQINAAKVALDGQQAAAVQPLGNAIAKATAKATDEANNDKKGSSK